MTRECDDSRHFADQHQQPSLTWDRIHGDEQYERTSHNFGQNRLSAGLSFDVGGAQINIGTGGRHHSGRYGNQGDAYYGSTYSQNYSNNYSHNSYAPDYRGYRGNQGYDNSYDNAYRQAAPQIITAETNISSAATQYYYDQLRNQQNNGRYQNSYNDNYQNSYNDVSQSRNYDSYQNSYNDAYQPSYYSGGYRNSDDRYVIRVNPSDQYYGNQSYGEQDYGPTNNRFDLQYTGSNNGFDRGNNQFDRYNSQQNWNDRYTIDAPSPNDYYNSNHGVGRYQGNRYSRDDYRQNYDGDQYGLQNRYSQNQYQQYRYPNGRYAEQYDSSYYGSNGYQNDYYGSGSNNGSDWMRMRSTLQSMLGHSPREFNRNVPDDLGCATIVSAALRQAHGVNIRDTNVDGLEDSLRRNGYQAIPMQYAKPGDCIIAHRAGNRHGHAAIYVGDGKVVNNSSAQGRVVVAPLQNFAARDYQSVVAYRRV